MALTSREVALITASKITTQRVDEIADDFQTWIAAQVTSATAIEALLTVSGRSKSPAVLLAYAQETYDALENDPTTITSITPNTGTTAGGTAVVIVGTNLTGATSVTFGGTAGTSFSVVDDSTIHVTTPAKTAGALNVVVVNPVSGNATSTNGFTYA